MAAKKLVGEIERIEASDGRLTVSGWAEVAASCPNVALTCGKHEIARFTFDREGKSPGRAGRRQSFSFVVPIPVTLKDVRNLSVAAPATTGRIVAKPNVLIGELPVFVTLDDVAAERHGDTVHWRTERRTKYDSRPRILFEASIEDGAAHGLALDVDDPSRVFSISIMSGTECVAQVVAQEQAEVESPSGFVDIDRGFFVEFPDDRLGRHADLWFALSEPAARAAPDAAARAVELLRFHEAPAGRSSRTAQASLIVVARDNADALREFLSAGQKAIAAENIEVIVVDTAQNRAVADVCKALSAKFTVKRIAENPLASRSKARNAGARAAAGDVLAFTDLSLRFPAGTLGAIFAKFADEEVGAAGVRIVEERERSTAGASGRVLHFGVHLDGEPGKCGLSAVISGAGSELAAASEFPIVVPAVDASFLVCRADLFEVLGGFDTSLGEEIAAADLCLRINGLLREVVSFNDISIAKVPGRAAYAPSHTGRTELPIARLVRRDLFDRPGFWSGRLPHLGIVAADDQDRLFATALATTIEAVVPARARVLSAADYDLAGVDAAIVLDPRYDLTQATAVNPAFTAFAWVRRDADAWDTCACADAYHGVIAASGSLIAGLRSWGGPIEVIAENEAADLTELPVPTRLKSPAGQTVSIGFGSNAGTDADTSVALTVAPRAKKEALRSHAVSRPAFDPKSLDTVARALLSHYRRQNEAALRFAIKIEGADRQTPDKQTPDNASQIGCELAQALRSLGHIARVDTSGRWQSPLACADDCVLAIRGSSVYRPQPGLVRLLWIVDRPDLVSAEELQSYDHVFAASAVSARTVRELCDVAVSVLPLAVSPASHALTNSRGGSRDTLLLVGDADRANCEQLERAVSLGLRASVWGHGWDGILSPDVIANGRVEILKQAPAFDDFEFVLIPQRRQLHRFALVPWPALEASAAGAKVITERIADIDGGLGSLVRMIDEGSTLESVIKAWRMETEAEKVARNAATIQFRAVNSFAERARVVANVAASIVAQISHGY